VRPFATIADGLRASCRRARIGGIRFASVEVTSAVRVPPDSLRFPSQPAGRGSAAAITGPVVPGYGAPTFVAPVAGAARKGWMILAPEPRTLYPDWATVAAEAVGTLRLDAGRYPDDPATRNLVGELAMTSDDFRRWWADHRVVERSHGTKRMRHPVVGELEIHYEAMDLPGDPDQTLFIYTTRPHSPSRDAMRLLSSWLASEDGRAAGAGRHPSDPTGRETSSG
jgi:MmyB-like transcription regulator ligand binding domain